MNTQSFSALIKMSMFASLLSFGLVILGNYGMFSSMPVEMKDNLSNQMHIDYIHLIYYVGFNFIFVGFLAYLLVGLKHSQQQMKAYLAQH